MNNFVTQVKRSAKDEAIKFAKQVRHESAEMVKPNILKTPEKSGTEEEMSMMQQVMTGDGKIKELPENEKRENEAYSKRRLQELEAELRNWRSKRQQNVTEWSKGQDEILGINQEEQKVEQPVIMPSGPQRGPKGKGRPGKGQQNKMEQGRTKKG